MPFLITNALLYGLGMSLILTTLMGASFLIAPDMWLRSYPLDIQARFGEMTEKARRLRKPVAIAFFGVILFLAGASLIRLQTQIGEEAGLLAFALSLFISLMVFNLYDLLILDWLLFTRFTLKLFILPGTKGMAGYDDYGFHFRAFLRGTLICAAGSAALGVLAWVVGRIVHLLL